MARVSKKLSTTSEHSSNGNRPLCFSLGRSLQPRSQRSGIPRRTMPEESATYNLVELNRRSRRGRERKSHGPFDPVAPPRRRSTDQKSLGGCDIVWCHGGRSPRLSVGSPHVQIKHVPVGVG